MAGAGGEGGTYSYTRITGGVQHGNTLETELHVLVALPYLVRGREVCFVISIGGRNNLRSSELPTSFTLEATKWVRVGRIKGWVI